MPRFGWFYRGTKTRVRIGDLVLISRKLATENRVARDAEVVDLRGFITVKLSDNSRMDVDARSLTLISEQKFKADH